MVVNERGEYFNVHRLALGKLTDLLLAIAMRQLARAVAPILRRARLPHCAILNVEYATNARKKSLGVLDRAAAGSAEMAKLSPLISLDASRR